MKRQSQKVPIPPLFPIVGIGTSAGGLEALEQFLRHVPAGCGMCVFRPKPSAIPA